MRIPFLPLRALAAIAGVVALAACEAANDPAELSQSAGAAYVVLPPSNPWNGAADVEEFELCKYGSSATFGYSVFDRKTSTTTAGSLSLNDGECRVIALFGDVGADVTVSETAAQSGFQLNRVDVDVITTSGTTSYTQTTPTVTEFISGTNGGGLRGALAEYYNAGVPHGGEGCTPGYWKQPQHFDSWPAPYQPTDLFSAYFENAFPGMTLLQVLSQGGGKLIALGRHTVAALLNSASSGVDYNLTTAQVIAEFNATYPASNYGPQKDRFAGFNEQGCPLN